MRGEKFLTTKFRKLQYKEMHLQKVYAYFKYWILGSKTSFKLLSTSHKGTKLSTLRACMRVMIVILCVCVHVYYYASCYISRLNVENKVS